MFQESIITSVLYPFQLSEKLAKLSQLKSGVELVSKSERDNVLKELSSGIDAWKKRKSMFKRIWCES